MQNPNAQLDDFLRDLDEAQLRFTMSLVFFEDYLTEKDEEKLNKAITQINKALEQTPQDDPARGERLHNLGKMKLSQHGLTKDPEDFKDGIDALQDSVSITPIDHPNRERYLNNFSSELLLKYHETRDFSYLQTIIDATPNSDSNRAIWLNNFSVQLLQLYERDGEQQDLESAIRIAKYAVETESKGSDRTACLHTMSLNLKRRYEAIGNHDDLTEAIRMGEMAVKSAPEKGIDRAASLAGLSVYLRMEDSYTGEGNHLQRSIEYAGEAVEAAGQDIRSIHCLTTLASSLEQRFEQTGNDKDLEDAIKYSKIAFGLGSQDPAAYPSLLNNLGGQLESKYLRTGDTLLLEDAIKYTKTALNAAPEKHFDRPLLLDSLATRLGRQYLRTGEFDHLEEAIKASRLSVAATGARSIYLPGRLNNLGNKLMYRYIRAPNDNDLKEAIKLTEDALGLVTEKHPSYAPLRTTLANLLQNRCRSTNNPIYLDQGIEMLEQLVNSIPEKHPTIVSKRFNLAAKLTQRYDRMKEPDDIDNAINILEDTINTIAEEQQDRPKCLMLLGGAYEVQSQTRNDQTYPIQRALECFLQAIDSPQALPLLRIRAVRKAINILRQRRDWRQADKLACKALSWLPLVCGRYLHRIDQLQAMVQVSGLAADAGSLALKVGDTDRAIEQLESGRGLVLRYMLDSRSELTELRSTHPDLANKYEELRFKISQEADYRADREQYLIERREAIQKLDGVVKEIRENPRYKQFLRGPTVNELKQAASDGPIIIVNVTDIGSDAIIVTKRGIKALSLPDFHQDTAPPSAQQHFNLYSSSRSEGAERPMDPEDEPKVTQRISLDQLSWLWSHCVKHVVAEMGEMGFLPSHAPPRVWWVGSGIATSFPFHAAKANSTNSAEDAISIMVSSYSPSIKTLAHSQGRSTEQLGPHGEKPSILVVAMPTTPGQKSLAGTKRESDAIKKVCGNIFSIESSESPSADKVLRAIPDSSIIHFACHAQSDHGNPLQSHLLLVKKDKDRLVIDRLSLSKISTTAGKERARMVFLSACSTAEVKHNKLRDEGMHLTAAFQIAGFPHVIGSLWSADDAACVKLAESFYSSLTQKGTTTQFSNDQVARSLRDAVILIRSQHPEDPSIWAPFVHFGA
jgi:hypothetical protein